LPNPANFREEARKTGAVYPYRGAPDEVLRCSYGILSGRADGSTILATGEHALRLALHLPYSLAGDP
jgi:hypothetical protein